VIWALRHFSLVLEFLARSKRIVCQIRPQKHHATHGPEPREANAVATGIIGTSSCVLGTGSPSVRSMPFESRKMPGRIWWPEAAHLEDPLDMSTWISTPCKWGMQWRARFGLVPCRLSVVVAPAHVQHAALKLFQTHKRTPEDNHAESPHHRNRTQSTSPTKGGGGKAPLREDARSG
jgi:hypothetical protein